MAIRSGLGGQVGFAAESTYGTYVAPNKFIEGHANMKDESSYIVGGDVAAGRMQKLGSRRVKTAYGASGTFSAEVANKGMGPLLQALMGTSVTPVIIGAGPGYTQTHTFADPFGKSLTVQEGLPDLSAGTVRPYSFLGCKVMSAEFSCAIGELLTAEWNLDSREVVESESLVAASYPVGLAPFNWVQSAVKIGATVGAAASVSGITGVKVNINRNSKTDRNYVGSGGRKAEPVLNDWQEISGTLDADFLDKTVLADRYHGGTGFALVWEFIGPALGAAFETFRITLPQCFFTGETPELEGPDVISGSFDFEASYDGATQPSIVYISSDTTL
jgi:hypothetical protein